MANKKVPVVLTDRKALRTVFEVLMIQHRFFEKDLYAYRVAFEVAQQLYPNLKLNDLIKDARKSPKLRKHLREKYGKLTVEKFLQHIDQEVSDQELRSFLAEWKPTGPSI
jgi:hypothetical protein